MTGPPRLAWGKRTYVMGILNVTPDSFSGDGLLANHSSEEALRAAVELGRRMVDDGADILDVGAESTRPAAVYGEHSSVDAETEAALAVPVVEALVAEVGDRALISIDTSKGEVARQALAAGASIVNDVWAGQRDPETASAARDADAYLVLMHNKEQAVYPDGLLTEILAWLRGAIQDATRAGVDAARLIVDPGIGFGKNSEMNVELLHRLGEFGALGLPILVGASRKRFLGDLLGDESPQRRLEGTAASVALSIANGADIVRVHDVREMARVARVSDAIARHRPRFG